MSASPADPQPVQREEPGFPPQPPAGSLDAQQRTWATWCHLAAFAGFFLPIGSVLGPLVIWLSKRHEYPLVDEEGKKAINFQITIAICFIGLFALFVVAAISDNPLVAVVSAICVFVLAIAWLIFVIVAAVRTNEGRKSNYPLAITFLK